MTDNEIIKALEPYIEGLKRATKGFFLRVDDKQEIEVLEKVTGMRVLPSCPACFIRVIRAAVAAYVRAIYNLQQTEQTEQKKELSQIKLVGDEKSNKRASQGNARKKKGVS